MPKGGSKPGERRGGRQKGVPNKATVERLHKNAIIDQIAKEIGQPTSVAAAAVDRAMSGRKLAKEELEEVVPIIKSVVAHFQQEPFAAVKSGGKATKAQWNDFRAWLELFVNTCVKLAPYQSPTYRAILVTTPTGEGAGAPDKVADLGDIGDETTRSAQTYLRLVKG